MRLRHGHLSLQPEQKEGFEELATRTLAGEDSMSMVQSKKRGLLPVSFFPGQHYTAQFMRWIVAPKCLGETLCSHGIGS